MYTWTDGHTCCSRVVPSSGMDGHATWRRRRRRRAVSAIDICQKRSNTTSHTHAVRSDRTGRCPRRVVLLVRWRQTRRSHCARRQITARRTICSVSGPKKKPRTIQLLFIARQHSRACGARCRYIISLRLSNAGIVSIRLYKSCRQTFYTVCYGRQSTFHTLQCHIVKIFERKGGLWVRYIKKS